METLLSFYSEKWGMPRWFPRAMLMQTEARVISNGPQTSRALAQISEALQYHCLNSRQAERESGERRHSS